MAIDLPWRAGSAARKRICRFVSGDDSLGRTQPSRFPEKPQGNRSCELQDLPFRSRAAANPQLRRMQSWASTGRLTLKLNKDRGFPRLDSREKNQEAPKASVIVFCEKTTGVAQFRAETSADSEFGVERLAGMVAMQCLVRGHNPDDFLVLVPAEKSLVERLLSRAKDLLQEGQAISNQASLSPRQQEVLHSVICNRANKEIACNLNITVRTVKFHISALLSKFGVQSRMELARRAAGFMRPTLLRDVPEMAEGLAGQAPVHPATRELGPVAVNAPIRQSSKTRSLRFPERTLTA